MLHVILLKSRVDRIRGKVKVKVPVHLESGRVVMGYRYKGLAEKKIEKREKLVKDVPILTHTASWWRSYQTKGWDEWYQALFDKNKIEDKLVSPESDIWSLESKAEKAQDRFDSIEEEIEALKDKIYDINEDLLEAKDSGSIHKKDELKLKKQKLKEEIKEWLSKKCEALTVVRTLEKETEAPLEGHLPSPDYLQRIGEKAIRVALFKAGLAHFEKPGYHVDARRLVPSSVGWIHPDPSDWQDDWADEANNAGKSLSDALHYAMASRLPEGSYSIPSGLAKLRNWIKEAEQKVKEAKPRDLAMYLEEKKRYGKYIQAANVVLDTIYRRTQGILRNMGYSPDSYLYLYRGMNVRGVKRGQVLNLRRFKHNPLSSWSFDPGTAKGFGDKVFVTKVKVKDIVSTYMTGLGCSEESEVLIPAHVAAIAKVVVS